MGSTAAQADTSTKTQGSTTAIVVTALALFSMFFGAGNLIFPPMIAVQAGDNFWPAILGFLGTGAPLSYWAGVGMIRPIVPKPR